MYVRSARVLGHVEADCAATSRATEQPAPDTLSLNTKSSLCLAKAICPHFAVDRDGLTAAPRAGTASDTSIRHPIKALTPAHRRGSVKPLIAGRTDAVTGPLP